MIDISTVAASVAALAGVALGSVLAGRSQIIQLRQAREQALSDRREATFTDFLAAYRGFRRVLMAEPLEVELMEQPDPIPPMPVIKNGGPYWEKIEAARARLDILAGDTPVWTAGETVAIAFSDLARCRSTYEPGAVPRPVVDASRHAEREFARAAREYLRGDQSEGSSS